MKNVAAAFVAEPLDVLSNSLHDSRPAAGRWGERNGRGRSRKQPGGSVTAVASTLWCPTQAKVGSREAEREAEDTEELFAVGEKERIVGIDTTPCK